MTFHTEIPVLQKKSRSVAPHVSHRRAAIGAITVMGLLSGCLAAPPSSPAATASAAASTVATPAASTTSEACTWSITGQVSTAASQNAGLPDTAAVYWLEPFQVAPGLRIVASGTFPDARYASLQVYNKVAGPFTLNGVGNALPDYQIAPDQGSVNPWQQQAAPGGHFTVSFREDVTPGQVNTLPLAPAGTTSGRGYLEYRVYLPAGGDFSNVTPPTLTLEEVAGSGSPPPCVAPTPSSTAPASAPAATPTATPAAPAPPSPSAGRPIPQLAFFKEAFDAATPNVDAAYALASLTPPGPGDVVVIQAKAPTYPAGEHPTPWPAANVDVRYWSMCIGLATATLPTVMNAVSGGGTDAGCRADDQTKLDASGDYTYVLGTEAQRAAIEAIPGATFLPFSAAKPGVTHILIFREFLASPGLASAVQKVSQDRDPAATAAVMGAFYPRAAICSLATLVAGGVAGCTK